MQRSHNRINKLNQISIKVVMLEITILISSRISSHSRNSKFNSYKHQEIITTIASEEHNNLFNLLQALHRQSNQDSLCNHSNSSWKIHLAETIKIIRTSLNRKQLKNYSNNWNCINCSKEDNRGIHQIGNKIIYLLQNSIWENTNCLI